MNEKVNGKIVESEEDSTRKGLKAEREVVVEAQCHEIKSNHYFLYWRW